MPPCRDVKVALHFVALQTPKNPARIPLSAPQLRRLWKLPLSTPSTHFPQNMSHMRILFPLALHGSTVMRVHSLSTPPVGPLAPIRRLAVE